MKYAIFTLAVIATIPAAVACSASKRLMGLAVMFLFATVALHESTSINFWPAETYRGTARGMEIAFMHLTAFTIVLGYLIKGRFFNPFRDKGMWIYLLYFIWSALSFRTAANPLYSWFELWKMIMMFLVFCAVYEWLMNTQDVTRVLMALSIPVIWNFYAVVKQHYFGGSGSVAGVFAHRNSMAMFMTALAPLFFAYYMSGRKNMRWNVAVLAFICAAAAALRTYSRGAIVCLPLGLGIAGAACFIRNFKQRMVGRIIPLVVIGFFGCALLLPRIIMRFSANNERSASTRVDLALSARNMMQDEPLFGIGLNNWGVKINAPYPYNVREWVLNPTSKWQEEYKDGVVETIYLLVAAECGLPGLGLLLIWFGYYWVSAFRLCKKLAGTSYAYIPAGLLGGFTSIFLQSVLEWVLKQSVNFAAMVALFAMAGFLNVKWRSLRAAESRKLKEVASRLAERRQEAALESSQTEERNEV